MKICLMSDSHGKHNEVKVPKDIDLIIHAGDVSMRGGIKEIKSFLYWFDSLKCRTNTKIFCAGNHDWLFQKNPTLARSLVDETESVVYLENELVEVEGLKIWGSPYQIWFYDWAFNFSKDQQKAKQQAEEMWSRVPLVDILVTHSPMKGVGDKTEEGNNIGCPVLYEKVMKVVRPKLHVFGHNHEGAGIYELDNGIIKSVNASVLNRQYQYTNDPIIVEL